MLAHTPLSLYNCQNRQEFEEQLQTQPQFDSSLPPSGQLPILIHFMLEKNREFINSLIEYGATLQQDDLIALCDLQCNLNIFEYTLEISNAVVESGVILRIAEDPQLTDFVSVLAKFTEKDDLQEMIFDLISLDIPNETIAAVLTVCQKQGVDLNLCDQKGNNLLHLVYQKRQFQLAKFVVKMMGDQADKALEAKNFQGSTPVDIKQQQENEIAQEKKAKEEQILQKRNQNMNKFVQRQENKKQQELKEKIEKENQEKIAKQAQEQLKTMEKYVPYFVVLLLLLVLGLIYFAIQYAIEQKQKGNFM